LTNCVGTLCFDFHIMKPRTRTHILFDESDSLADMNEYTGVDCLHVEDNGNENMNNEIETLSEQSQNYEYEVDSYIPFGPANKRYWDQRHILWTRYEEGIRMDMEGWYSVTPEIIANYTAARMADTLGPNAVVIDAMTGVGGNAIQFAMYFPIVYAIDNNRERLDLAKHNAGIYSVMDKIEFIAGDFLQIAQYWTKPVDAIFLSPPWGGPSYVDLEQFDLTKTNPNIIEIFRAAEKITPNICLYLPRNTNLDQLLEMAGPGNTVEVQKIHLSDRLKLITKPLSLCRLHNLNLNQNL